MPMCYGRLSKTFTVFYDFYWSPSPQFLRKRYKRLSCVWGMFFVRIDLPGCSTSRSQMLYDTDDRVQWPERIFSKEKNLDDRRTRSQENRVDLKEDHTTQSLGVKRTRGSDFRDRREDTVSRRRPSSVNETVHLRSPDRRPPSGACPPNTDESRRWCRRPTTYTESRTTCCPFGPSGHPPQRGPTTPELPTPRVSL